MARFGLLRQAFSKGIFGPSGYPHILGIKRKATLGEAIVGIMRSMKISRYVVFLSKTCEKHTSGTGSQFAETFNFLFGSFWNTITQHYAVSKSA